MTKITRDIPENEGMTVADRLKAARTDVGMTRKALAEATGIPYSSIEKYERGDMDPGTARLQTICEQLEISVNWVHNGEAVSNITATPKPAETLPSANAAESSTETLSVGTPENPKSDNIDPMEHIRCMLSDLDDVRLRGFGGFQRKAMALVKDIRAALNYLEPENLMTLAFEQGLYEDENYLDETDIQDLFTEDFEKGQTYCVNIEERILDAAIFGIDLFKLEIEPLHALADDIPNNIDLKKPSGWNLASWSEEYHEFIPYVRAAFWAMALTGIFPNLLDQETFPRREISAQNDEDDDSEKKSGIGFF